MKIRIRQVGFPTGILLALALVSCGSPAGTEHLVGPTSTSSGEDGGSGSSSSGGEGGSGGVSTTAAVTGGGGTASCSEPCSLPNAIAVCLQGQCRIQSCLEGYSDCDSQDSNGCEVQTATDLDHCGSCNNPCSHVNGDPSCQAGSCSMTCISGFGDFDYGDCDNDPSNGCETQLNTIQNCGACGTGCGTNQVCQQADDPTMPDVCWCPGVPTSDSNQYNSCLECLGYNCCPKLITCLDDPTCAGIYQTWQTCIEGGGTDCAGNNMNSLWVSLAHCQEANSCATCGYFL